MHLQEEFVEPMAGRGDEISGDDQEELEVYYGSSFFNILQQIQTNRRVPGNNGNI